MLLFARQRAHDHQGGGWPGEPDTLLDAMRTRTAEVRRRVEARGPGMGVWRGDLTRLTVDAIVNAANRTLAGGGGVDGAIHRAVGPELKAACLALPEVSPGERFPMSEARITDGFALPAQHVIHTVGPVWRSVTAASVICGRRAQSEHVGLSRNIDWSIWFPGARGRPNCGRCHRGLSVGKRRARARCPRRF